MSADGKLDLYAEDDISMHTPTDSNLYCVSGPDADTVNIKARKGDMNVEMAMGESTYMQTKILN